MSAVYRADLSQLVSRGSGAGRDGARVMTAIGVIVVLVLIVTPLALYIVRQEVVAPIPGGGPYGTEPREQR